MWICAFGNLCAAACKSGFASTALIVGGIPKVTRPEIAPAGFEMIAGSMSSWCVMPQPALFWGLIASMWVGNLMLLIINLPLIGIWIRLLRIPYRLLFPAILTFSCIGVYGSEMSPLQVLVMIAFGLVGYFLKKVDAEPAPLLLGFILGPMMEENLRRSMTYSRGDLTIFLERPISAALLVMAALLVAAMIFPSLRTFRRDAFKEE